MNTMKRRQVNDQGHMMRTIWRMRHSLDLRSRRGTEIYVFDNVEQIGSTIRTNRNWTKENISESKECCERPECPIKKAVRKIKRNKIK